MRMNRINPKWQDAIREQLRTGTFTEIIESFNPAVQWLVKELVRREIPFRVLNLGAGVKKITTKVETCPKCHGTGKC